jgi:hypothetical protein
MYTGTHKKKKKKRKKKEKKEEKKKKVRRKKIVYNIYNLLTIPNSGKRQVQ